MNIVVLGCGMVGSAIAIDLGANSDFVVTVCDADQAALDSAKQRCEELNVVRCDLSDSEVLAKLCGPANAVVNATPGWLGFEVFRALARSGKKVVDIAFFSEDARVCSEVALKTGTQMVFDCGVAPGLSNMFVAEAAAALDTVAKVAIYVGGLVKQADNIYNYRAVFSPSDVLEEYVRPARVRLEGRTQELPALSQREKFLSDELGELEAFVTDGLRSLLDTIDCDSMIEKTLRFPGHADQAELLRDTGLLSLDEIAVGGSLVRPRDLTARLLFPIWKFRECDRDLTVMRVIVEGEKGGEKISYTYDLVDEYDEVSATSSMARTTGYTAAAVLNAMLRGELKAEGVCVPEELGRNMALVGSIREYLAQRGVEWSVRREAVSS